MLTCIQTKLCLSRVSSEGLPTFGMPSLDWPVRLRGTEKQHKPCEIRRYAKFPSCAKSNYHKKIQRLRLRKNHARNIMFADTFAKGCRHIILLEPAALLALNCVLQAAFGNNTPYVAFLFLSAAQAGLGVSTSAISCMSPTDAPI